MGFFNKYAQASYYENTKKNEGGVSIPPSTPVTVEEPKEQFTPATKDAISKIQLIAMNVNSNPSVMLSPLSAGNRMIAARSLFLPVMGLLGAAAQKQKEKQEAEKHVTSRVLTWVPSA